jgi:hypothetical protein
MLAEYFKNMFVGDNLVYWIVAGFFAFCLVGIKLVMINFDRKNKDKK